MENISASVRKRCIPDVSSDSKHCQGSVVADETSFRQICSSRVCMLMGDVHIHGSKTNVLTTVSLGRALDGRKSTTLKRNFRHGLPCVGGSIVSDMKIQAATRIWIFVRRKLAEIHYFQPLTCLRKLREFSNEDMIRRLRCVRAQINQRKIIRGWRKRALEAKLCAFAISEEQTLTSLKIAESCCTRSLNIRCYRAWKSSVSKIKAARKICLNYNRSIDRLLEARIGHLDVRAENRKRAASERKLQREELQRMIACENCSLGYRQISAARVSKQIRRMAENAVQQKVQEGITIREARLLSRFFHSWLRFANLKSKIVHLVIERASKKLSGKLLISWFSRSTRIRNLKRSQSFKLAIAFRGFVTAANVSTATSLCSARLHYFHMLFRSWNCLTKSSLSETAVMVDRFHRRNLIGFGWTLFLAGLSGYRLDKRLESRRQEMWDKINYWIERDNLK